MRPFPTVRRRSLVLPLLALGLLLLPAPLVAPPAAQVPVSGERPTLVRSVTNTMELVVGQGRLLRLPGTAESVLVATPEIADVQVPAPNTVFVFGKLPGRTTVHAVGPGGTSMLDLEVRVVPDLERLRRALGDLGPEARVSAELTNGGLLLTGEVGTPSQAQVVTALAVQAMGKPEFVLNQLKVRQPTQVNLRVRVAEVSRSVTRELGVNWESLFNVGEFIFGFAQGRDFVGEDGSFLRAPSGANSFNVSRQNGRLDVNAMIDALEDNGLVTVLAEPNLVARSGETASFLSGGEFPIPVSQDEDTVSVEFKQFGVILDFTPTVLDDGLISLKVRPEVSELSEANSILIDGLRIPGLSIRRAETTVELGSGQSFAIAGLLQADASNTLASFPGLGNIPILGTLFRSTRFQRNETELVIVVTPYLVRPTPSPTALAVPTDATQAAMDFGSLLLGRLTPLNPGARLRGDTGFILE